MEIPEILLDLIGASNLPATQHEGLLPTTDAFHLPVNNTPHPITPFNFINLGGVTIGANSTVDGDIIINNKGDNNFIFGCLFASTFMLVGAAALIILNRSSIKH